MKDGGVGEFGVVKPVEAVQHCTIVYAADRPN